MSASFVGKPRLHPSSPRVTTWTVGKGLDAVTCDLESFADTWDAHARFDILADSLRARHEGTPGKSKRWEYMAQAGGNTWNVRSVIDGKEDNVWLWKTTN